MQKYECVVLLPLTLKEAGTNPVGYPLMVFECDPNLTEGERRTLRYQECKDSYIQFDALVVKRSQSSKNDANIISYLFEIVDRDFRVSASNFVALDTDKKLETLREYQFFIQNRTNCRK